MNYKPNLTRTITEYFIKLVLIFVVLFSLFRAFEALRTGRTCFQPRHSPEICADYKTNPKDFVIFVLMDFFVPGFLFLIISIAFKKKS